MEEIDDRRGSGRVYIMTTVELTIAGEAVEATALDLSLTGLSVWAPPGRSPAGPIGLRMVIDDEGALRLTCRVARQYESDGGAVWGLAFQDADAAVQARLQAYLETVG